MPRFHILPPSLIASYISFASLAFSDLPSSTSIKVNDIYEEIDRFDFTEDEKITLYAFFINNPDKKGETEKVFTCLRDKGKVGLLRKLLTSGMFSHFFPRFYIYRILTYSCAFLSCFLSSNPPKKNTFALS
ncbi:hypothetical protein RclHR1_13630006 [Rhizophagus clarus]|uniref:Uncharacterized protein n=1 Tax=Rhizophagus clarus TaxID=94130 RepID=A0A2Z6R341_9GLOM|nr:hypothetical protein RclHR1_13630006 [Rhizophagus clarus]